MNKKQVIRLNESQLRRIVSESVKTILVNEGLGKIARRYGISIDGMGSGDAESMDRAKGDSTPNEIIEYSKNQLVYSNKDGYIVRIDTLLGGVFVSKEPGGRSYMENNVQPIWGVYNHEDYNYTYLGLVANFDSNNMPDKVLVSSKVLAFKIVTWIKLVLQSNTFKCRPGLTKANTWLAFN